MAALKVGDRVRRGGMLGQLFGDDPGAVTAIRNDSGNDQFEVDFGSRRTVLYENQIRSVSEGRDGLQTDRKAVLGRGPKVQQEACHMRAMKVALMLAVGMALIRYGVVYYRCSEFNHFVKQEAHRTRGHAELRHALLTKAVDHMLPVREENINVTTTGPVLRVAVDYQVPVDFYLFRYELAFHTVASGPIWKR